MHPGKKWIKDNKWWVMSSITFIITFAIICFIVLYKIR